MIGNPNKPDNVVRFPAPNSVREFWLHVTQFGTELRFNQEPNFEMTVHRFYDEPTFLLTVHCWAYRGREYAVTYSREAQDHYNRSVFLPVMPPGRGWKRCNGCPEFIKPQLKTHRPSAVWSRMAVRS